ncbi:hypothetical protein M758_6G014200 [Ceratodon purpureus]|nr:hypothetical protein M758_6G014200 [Ceratodon purpureus]
MSRVTRSRTHFVMCSYPTNHVQVVEMRGRCPGASPVSSRAGSGAAQSWYRMSCHHHYRCFVYDFLMDLHPRFWKHIPVHEYWSQDSCSSSLVQLQDVSWTLESVLLVAECGYEGEELVEDPLKLLLCFYEGFGAGVGDELRFGRSVGKGL